ncbi:hypothetical protein [Gynuella sunshinyii]|uniref:Uncharacterized protein n=1 Tax=Gynuella sunshinyii YC6258 TaxID=1445510 RepID=A0A0C5VVR0_9GAMM|nr:hypothetical protein [Gynuella sunshinyii]AJQ94554.1 hypothetical Protein YC6258_02516 [Gynuella sunshinyii YC6258]
MRSNIFLAFFLVLFFALVLFRYAPLPRVLHDPISLASFAFRYQKPTTVTTNSLSQPSKSSIDTQHELVDLKTTMDD